VCVCVCVCVCARARARVCVCVCVCVCICVYMYICMYIYICVCVCIYFMTYILMTLMVMSTLVFFPKHVQYLAFFFENGKLGGLGNKERYPFSARSIFGVYMYSFTRFMLNARNDYEKKPYTLPIYTTYNIYTFSIYIQTCHDAFKRRDRCFDIHTYICT